MANIEAGNDEQLIIKALVASFDLCLCIATWEGDTDSLSSNVLRGIAHLVVAYEDGLKDDMFVEKVGRASPREIGRIAKGRKAGYMGYAEAMLTLYNKKSSTKGTLKWAKLYEKKQAVDMEYV